MKTDDFLRRADELIAQSNAVLSTQFTSSYTNYVNAGQIAGLRAAALSFLSNVFGESHSYYRNFDTIVRGHELKSGQAAREILVAARQEVAGGWFTEARRLVTAEIFSDFLEMADHLLTEHYKDAAAVMTGSVLEEHLRELCRRNGVDTEFVRDGKPVPKKADLLNSELASANVYNKLDQKAVTTWLDLRNKAAHGKYDEYSEQQVALLLQGVTDFMARTGRL